VKVRAATTVRVADPLVAVPRVFDTVTAYWPASCKPGL
jgi:hypothetical protein